MGRLTAALILAASALPMAPASATDRLNPNLQPLAFLAGSCWRTTMPGNGGTDTHCFTPMLGGHFLRDRHILSAVRYSGETLYRWDSAARRIRFDYYSSEGMLMSGTASSSGQGLTFELSYVSAEGRPVAMRAAWTRDGPDAYIVTQEVGENGAWRAVPDHPRFERVGPAAD